MRRFSFQLAKVVTALTEQGWSQIHTFSPEEKEKLLARGHFLAVITLAKAEKEKAAAWGREIIARLHEEYYGEVQTPPLAKLKQTIQKVAVEIEPEAQLAVTAVALVGDILYVAILGQGRLVLKRKSRLATILTGTDQQILTASGYLQDGDFFLLGSSDFFRLIPQQAIRQALSAKSADEAAEILAPLAHESDGQGLVAALVAKTVRLEEKKEKPKILLKWPKRLFNWQAIYLRVRRKEKSKKTLLTVALILLLILTASVFLGRQQRQRFGQKQKATELARQIQDKKEESEAILSLNPARAKELLLEVQTLLEQAKAEGLTSSELTRLEKEVEALLPKVIREHEIQPELFFDLVFLKDDARADDVVLSADNLLILDKAKSVVYQLTSSLPNRSAIAASGEKLADSLQMTAAWPQVFVLTPEGIYQAEKNQKPKLVIKAEIDSKLTVDFQTFAGSLYLLTKETIWQYSAAEIEFSAKRNWLASQKAAFSKAVSMAIDGSIWVLSGEEILKFTRGRQEPFGVAGLDKPFSQPKAIFTNSDQERLYVLDNGNSRVVVLDKSGEYYSQYLWQGIREATGLIASEKEGKIFIFNQNEIYAIEIK